MNGTLAGGAPRNLEHPDPLPAMHRIREDGPGLDRSEMVERGEHGSEPFEPFRHRSRINGYRMERQARRAAAVRIQIGKEHRHANLSGEAAPGGARAGAEGDAPARPLA